MTRFVAPIGPGWARVEGGPSHILSGWPLAGVKRWRTYCGSIRVRDRTVWLWAFLAQPTDPCRDCDRALQVERIHRILGRIR